MVSNISVILTIFSYLFKRKKTYLFILISKEYNLFTFIYFCFLVPGFRLASDYFL